MSCSQWTKGYSGPKYSSYNIRDQDNVSQLTTQRNHLRMCLRSRLPQLNPLRHAMGNSAFDGRRRNRRKSSGPTIYVFWSVTLTVEGGYKDFQRSLWHLINSSTDTSRWQCCYSVSDVSLCHISIHHPHRIILDVCPISKHHCRDDLPCMTICL